MVYNFLMATGLLVTQCDCGINLFFLILIFAVVYSYR